MSRLEEKLRDVLRREEPPSGFTERVLARTVEATRNERSRRFARRGLRWGLAGALCLELMMVGIEYRQVQVEKARSEAAKEQLMLALRITGEQLQFVWSKVTQP